MNKNFENYKSTYSAFRPSDEAIERVMDMTKEKQRLNFKLTYKRLAASALALALFIGGGIGISHYTDKGNDLTVMIAYAGQEESITTEEAVKNDLTLDGNPYFFDFEDEEHSYSICDLFLSTPSEDYERIDNLKVTTESIYGQVDFGYYYLQDSPNGSYYNSAFERGYKDNDIVFSGEQLIQSLAGFQELKEETLKDYPEAWTDYDEQVVKAGYYVYWFPSYDVYDEIVNNPEYDLSQIKDTVTFTVTYKDGTVKTSSINLYFDSDGYIHFG